VPGREVIQNRVGHNVPQEAPDAFAEAILEVGGGGK
jgi:pimeloyl-ACP methyl ester carboxylesterase